jgi:hypothetical protein
VSDRWVLGRAGAVGDLLELGVDGTIAKAIETVMPRSCGYISFLDGDTLVATVVGGDVAYLGDDSKSNGDSYVAS